MRMTPHIYDVILTLFWSLSSVVINVKGIRGLAGPLPFAFGCHSLVRPVGVGLYHSQFLKTLYQIVKESQALRFW